MTAMLAQRVHELGEQLHLSRRTIGEIVGASERTVSRWSTGEVRPQHEPRKRLLELHYVAEVASEVLEPEYINDWIFEPNRLLDGDTPAARIQQGNYKDVLAVIEVLAEGVVI